MTKLHLVSLCLIGLATPAMAQMTLTVTSDSSAPDSSAMDMSIMESSAPPPADSSAMEMSVSGDDEGDVSQVPSGPPVASKDALAAFLKTCTDVSGGDPAAYDRANADGWVPDDSTDSGPYRRIYSASKDVGGYGSVTLWGSVDTYPTQQLGYCRVDFGDYDNLIDLKDMEGLGGLAGSVTPKGDNDVYGAWETADKKLLVIADRTDGQVEIEYNILLGAKK